MGSKKERNFVEAPITALPDVFSKESREQHVAMQKELKLQLLAARYGLEGGLFGSWALAMKIAEDFHPGFKVIEPSRRGRSEKWTFDQQLALVSAVSARCSDTVKPHAACKQLAGHGLYRRISHPTLYRQYTAAKKAIASFKKKALGEKFGE